MKSQLVLLALVPLAFLPGCGGSGEQRKPVFVVTGKVTDAGGKPVAGAQVIFHPATADEKTPKPTGKTDENGQFKLTTYDGNDGAPAGEYKVSVTQQLATTADGFPANRLPAKYGVPDQSGFVATVGTAPTDVPAFQIKK